MTDKDNHHTVMRELARRMGMKYEPLPELADETSMFRPAAVKRMHEVYATNERVPDIFEALSDYTIANMVRMLYRDSMNHEAIVCAARNRIFRLSLQNYAQIQMLLKLLCIQICDIFVYANGIRFIDVTEMGMRFMLSPAHVNDNGDHIRSPQTKRFEYVLTQTQMTFMEFEAKHGEPESFGAYLVGDYVQPEVTTLILDLVDSSIASLADADETVSA